jgi:cell wall-associated NlpC family hydrolase
MIMSKTLLLKNLSDLLVEQGRKYGEMINLSTGEKVGDEIGSLDFTDVFNITKKGAKNLKVSETGQAIADAATTQLGKPYSWGDEAPEDGFDCSGLVFWAYSQAGINLPTRTAQTLQKQAKVIDKSEVLPGDMIFFDTGSRVDGADHIGIVHSIEGEKINMIHAESTKTGIVITKDILNGYYGGKLMNFGRIE